MKLELLLPTKPFLITQNYGEDTVCVDTITYKKVVSKYDGVCPVGYTSLYLASGLKGHNGLDVKTRRYQPIYSATDGFVAEKVDEEARGKGLGIITREKYEFHTPDGRVDAYAKTRYWHLAGFAVMPGQEVKRGDLLGWADNTGYSSGDHLHFELKPVLFDENDQDYYNCFQNNGMKGAISPLDYLSQLSADEINSFLIRIRMQIKGLLNLIK